MAKMVKSFFQGAAWQNGDKKIVAHRNHRVNVNRKRRNRLGAAPVEWKRGGKKQQIGWKNKRMVEVRHYKYIKWARAHPNSPKKDNPFRIQPQPFKNTEMKDALIAAGVLKA